MQLVGMGVAAFLAQAVGMASGATVQDEIHANVDEEPGAGHDEHDGGLLYELFVNDAGSGLDDEEEGDDPDDEEVS